MNQMLNLSGKKGLILGVANDQSIAWGCALMAKQMGAELIVTCQNEKARKYVEPLLMLRIFSLRSVTWRIRVH